MVRALNSWNGTDDKYGIVWLCMVQRLSATESSGQNVSELSDVNRLLTLDLFVFCLALPESLLEWAVVVWLPEEFPLEGVFDSLFTMFVCMTRNSV